MWSSCYLKAKGPVERAIAGRPRVLTGGASWLWGKKGRRKTKQMNIQSHSSSQYFLISHRRQFLSHHHNSISSHINTCNIALPEPRHIAQSSARAYGDCYGPVCLCKCCSSVVTAVFYGDSAGGSVAAEVHQLTHRCAAL